jgi:hypothetical protein
LPLPWKLKRVLQTFLGEDRIYNRASYRPDFSLVSFNALLHSHSGKDAVQALTREQIVAFFTLQQSGQRLIQTSQVLSLAEHLALNHGQWRQQVLDAAAEICYTGLPVYANRLAPLNRQFPWLQLKKGLGGDPLYISRPQRFGFATVVAQAALFEGKYLKIFVEILDGWKQYACKSPYRWPYNSCHALVYRVVALVCSWSFILAIHQKNATSASAQALYNILDILRNDIAYLAPRLGKAHPNNHLLADYFIGWFIEKTFPAMIPKGYDFSPYESLWQQQVLRQYYCDGGCFEHSMHYHEHGCEMALIYCLLSVEKNLPAALRVRIKAMLAFGLQLNGVFCRPWSLGDTTEDCLLPLGAETGCNGAALLQVFNHLYPESAQPAGSQTPNLKSFWLLGGHNQIIPNTSEQDNEHCIFKDSGLLKLSFMKQQNELLFRTGVSSETEFMSGHMHADILSIYWRLAGQDLLGVSGTASYKFVDTDSNNARAYFCGPRAHSCVLIQDQDPLGEMSGDFRDQDNGLRVNFDYCQGDRLAFIALASVESSNIYHGLKRLVLSIDEQYYLVLDLFTQAQRRIDCKVGWFFDSAIELELETYGLRLQANGCYLAKLVSSATDYTLHKGQVDPLNGWQSKAYGEKQAAYYAQADIALGQPALAHVLTTHKNIMQCELFVDQEKALLKVVVSASDWQDVIYIGLTDPLSTIDTDDFFALARACIVRKTQGKLVSLIAVQCHTLDWPEQNIHFTPARVTTRQWLF